METRNLHRVARSLGLDGDDLIPYGHDVGKVQLSARARPRVGERPARLILVSAITPTPAGEGKTTTAIGLGDALALRGQRVCLALREPSMGPCFGLKGGGTGGGRSQLTPAERINLHFTGDIHAVGAAHNLLAAVIDNHMHHGNALRLDPRRIHWRRVMDMNDRALRNVVTGLGGHRHGVPREGGFDITAASEVMAMLCLAEDAEDLRARLDRTLVAFTYDGEPVTAGRLGATGAMLVLLRDALLPNLVQTLEGTPALVHGGPFANIAHGCNSVIATRTALHLADWCVTEAGFGFDLGAEKFYDIACRQSGLTTAAVVLVVSVRALKLHGGYTRSDLEGPDAAAVTRGLPNLAKHVQNIRCFGQRAVVALNRFASDTPEEIAAVRAWCEAEDVPFAESDHHARGGEGALALADAVLAHADEVARPFTPLYDNDQPVPDKIASVARAMYGARDVVFTREAQRDLAAIETHGYSGLPVCIAKTHSSLSDDPRRRGRPRDFEVSVESLVVNAGAGFIVVFTGDIVRMPGLPRRPRAERVDLVDGEVIGLLD
jgi:formate--tetrahydrofolate ligase